MTEIFSSKRLLDYFIVVEHQFEFSELNITIQTLQADKKTLNNGIPVALAKNIIYRIPNDDNKDFDHDFQKCLDFFPTDRIFFSKQQNSYFSLLFVNNYGSYYYYNVMKVYESYPLSSSMLNSLVENESNISQTHISNNNININVISPNNGNNTNKRESISNNKLMNLNNIVNNNINNTSKNPKNKDSKSNISSNYDKEKEYLSNITTSNALNRFKEIYVPKYLILITTNHLPVSSKFLLEEIYFNSIVNDARCYKIENIICYLMFRMYLPANYSTQMSFALGKKNYLFTDNPLKHEFSIKFLFALFSPENIVKLFLSTLMDSKIIIIHDSR